MVDPKVDFKVGCRVSCVAKHQYDLITIDKEYDVVWVGNSVIEIVNDKFHLNTYSKKKFVVVNFKKGNKEVW